MFTYVIDLKFPCISVFIILFVQVCPANGLKFLISAASLILVSATSYSCLIYVFITDLWVNLKHVLKI